jgi:hypothetical protein
MARSVEIEVLIMILFTMSRAGTLIMSLNGKSRFYELPWKSIEEEIYDGF